MKPDTSKSLAEFFVTVLNDGGRLLGNVLRLPKFLLLHTLGLLLAITSEFEAFAVAVVGVLVGLVTAPLIGAAVALTLYLVLRQILTIAQQSVGVQRLQAEQTNYLAMVVRDNPYFAEKVQAKANADNVAAAPETE